MWSLLIKRGVITTVSHEVNTCHCAGFFRTYTAVASPHIFMYIYISICQSPALQQGADTKQDSMIFRVLLAFISRSSWVLGKAFMEPVLLTFENCTLYSGQDQGHVDTRETRVDTFPSYFSFVWLMIHFGWRYT